MERSGTFTCIDAHTCGNPVRVVIDGAPALDGDSMVARRQDFIARYDWIRTGLMFEPRGHDVMSGSILMPPTRSDRDLGVLYIEVSGCLPMCGHGTIGTVTVAVEQGLVEPATPGVLRLDTPAGLVTARYRRNGGHVDAVSITNVPSFLAARSLAVDVEGFGPLVVDVAYGGNFYAIVDPQPGYQDLSELTPAEIRRLSPLLRRAVNAAASFRHPLDPTIAGVSHVMWTGRPRAPEANGRNAVFYGEAAIDRSPCGTGTSARLAQLHARGLLAVGERFVHESVIGSLFEGMIQSETEVDGLPAVVPSITGWARVTGRNTIIVDPRDPFAYGFQLI